MLASLMLGVSCAEFGYDECCYDDCRYAESSDLFMIMLNIILQSVTYAECHIC
jgi:hypothetical protein